VARAAVPTEASSRERILTAARAEFAERGFEAARLQDIAERAGLRHPTLHYYFSTKEGLYGAVIAQAVADWAEETRLAIENPLRGFEQVATLVEAGFRFFEQHEDFVRIVRREALEGGGRLDDAIAEFLRPFLERSVAFLEREVAAGRLRPHDPVELMQIVYGAALTYFSDARFRSKLTGEEPLRADARRRHCAALIALLRPALDPAAERGASALPPGGERRPGGATARGRQP
jgi:TetR/AcrR family transcriptional regulator